MLRHKTCWSAVAVLILAGALTGCASGSSPEAESCRLASSEDATTGGDSSGVKVVDQGFSIVSSENGNTRNASMGAVVENTTDQVAYRTWIRFDVTDSYSNSAVSEVMTRYKLIEIPFLQPHSTTAVGMTLSLEHGLDATDLTIDVFSGAWMNPGSSGNGLAPVTSTLDAEDSTLEDDASATISYTTENPNCTAMISRGTSMLWRDSAGTIIGGNTDGSTTSDCRSGAAEHSSSPLSDSDTVPEDVDLSRSELTVLCDVSPRVAGDDRPFN